MIVLRKRLKKGFTRRVILLNIFFPSSPGKKLIFFIEEEEDYNYEEGDTENKEYACDTLARLIFITKPVYNKNNGDSQKKKYKR